MRLDHVASRIVNGDHSLIPAFQVLLAGYFSSLDKFQKTPYQVEAGS